MDRPLIRAVWRALVVLGHIYPSTLWRWSPAALVTRAPRVEVTRETLAGVTMRVGWWLPGGGGAHPAMLWVIGATPEGIDFPELRTAAEGFARAGYLVMIPDLPFMKEERLDPTGPLQLAAAFDVLRAHPRALAPIGAFGFSFGGGVLLAAAGRDERLGRAPYLAVLGAYFEMATYLASVVSRAQRRDGRTVGWTPSPDVPERLAAAAARLATNDAERAELERALAPAPYEDALAAIATLPAGTLASLARLSPRPAWERVRAPVYWVHDENDAYVPVAELESARRATRGGRLEVLVPRLLQHAVPVADSARGAGLRFWVAELWGIFRFAAALFRAAG